MQFPGSLTFEVASAAPTSFAGKDDLGAYDGERFDSADAKVAGSIRHYRDRDLTVLRLEATDDLTGIATGDFATPSYAWRLEPAAGTARNNDGLVAFGYQYTEFAMPTLTDASLTGWFLFPMRPSVVLPMMLIAPGGETLLLAPLDNFHEQIIGVGDDAPRWGWHGDLDEVPAGFATELALLSGPGPRACLDEWAGELLRRHDTHRPGRYDDDLNARLSYWTDNGAAYWYKTEPGHDVTSTLVGTIDDLRGRDIPVSTVQLDSWFYPHETLRPFDTDEWIVPPTGLMEWDARADILPNGIRALHDALGRPPLTAHCRHLAAASPYTDEFDCWIDGDRAHPKSDDLYERWLDQAMQWGVTTFEHDWLIECFLGVRGLREAPGRARAWQEGVDHAAEDRGLTLQWCMPSPADLCQTVTLLNVASIRTSGDHGYLVSPGYLWAWFLYTNAFAGALGLRPFKDVFFSDPGHTASNRDVEALLSALSTGPVGIGDRRGRADAELIRRTCRADGVLVKPDTPVAALDRSFRQWATGRGALLVGAATTRHTVGDWTYLVTLNAGNERADGRISVSDAGIDGDVLVWDWRTQTISRDDAWDVALEPQDWDLRVVAPIVDGRAVIGDPSLYATAGDARIADVRAREHGRLLATVLGGGETVDVVTWSDDDGLMRNSVRIPERGWTTLEV